MGEVGLNFYNDIDPKACAWLSELMAHGLIPLGVIDNRSITDIDPNELTRYTQCHFFAGIGGWPLAIRWAGWPEDRPVWTGSCPCQPFSVAGKRKGEADERHLWPAFRDLIAKCRPPVCFGEQVASKDGREWLVGVRADLEALGYAVGAADLCAAGVGAPHIRQRLYWVADSDRGAAGERGDAGGQTGPRGAYRNDDDGRCGAGGLADSGRAGPPEQFRRRVEPEGPAAHGGLDGPGPTNGHWRDADWIFCRDGKWRPVEPGTFPLAHGIPGRVGLLRGYGNAIVPQVAAEFIKAFLSIQ